jgi:Cu(I)/Ag(I) efflux system membrane fusion protein
MRPVKKILAQLFIGMGLLALGALAGGWWVRHTGAGKPATQAGDQRPEGERRVLYWYDPMFPQHHFDRPGKSPFMDMDLIPKYADEEEGSPGVKIDPSLTQNLGIRLAPVKRLPLAREIHATGIVGFNERAVAVVQARAAGFVERVWPLAPGEVVHAGQPLAELLVPEWTAAQHEWLAIRASGEAGLATAARERLRLLGMPEHMIKTLEQTGTVQSRYVVTAPIDGVLQALEVRAGMTLMAGQTLARINGLATVWVEAAVPESVGAAVAVGNRAQVTVAGVASPSEGRIIHIVPMLNEATRTLRVRIELPNRDGRLRPGMSARVTFRSESGQTALAVPTEAIIYTGKRTLVMRAEGDGRYTPVEVAVGEEWGDWTVITAGLEEGQQVVASGQFLIDSEAKLTGVAPLVASVEAALHAAEARIDDIADGKITLTHGPLPDAWRAGHDHELRPGAAGGGARVCARRSGQGFRAGKRPMAWWSSGWRKWEANHDCAPDPLVGRQSLPGAAGHAVSCRG